MILHIPVRRTKVKIEGETREVLELANGFVSVTTDVQFTDNSYPGAPGGRSLISNPLAEVFQDLFQRGLLGAGERVAIALEELPNSNPGADDESTSLNHLDVIV